MIGDSQTQKVAENSTAIQAKRDVNIGASISEVMSLMAQNMQIYSDFALKFVNDRLYEFEKRLTDKFLAGEPDAIRAFSDPDMQAALLDAQKVYVRSDESELHDVLTDLIYHRAIERSKNRRALILNDAINKTGMLTKSDFANLAFIFHIMGVGFQGNLTPALLALRFKSHILPLLPDLDFSIDALEYLHSRGLFLIGPNEQNLTPIPLAQLLSRRYPEVLNTGFSMNEISEFFGGFDLPNFLGIVKDSPFESGKHYISLTASGFDQLAKVNPHFFNDPEFGRTYCKKCLERPPTDDQVIQEISKEFPEFQDLCNRYNSSRIGVTKLTPVGVAIGHSYIVKESGFIGNLDVWIKG